MSTADTIVVGGGVIGLSIAWTLARAGMVVRVVERDRVGSHASSAAAGMLAPLAEDCEGPLFELSKASLDLYPTFLEQLAFDSEMDVPLEGPGLLRLAFTGQEADALTALAHSPAGTQMGAEWLNDRQVREFQPNLGDQVVGALLTKTERHINPRRLVESLRRACERQRVSFLEGLHAERPLPAGPLKVFAAGAWTGEVLADFGLSLPIRPVKGQVAMLRQPAQDLRYTLYGDGGYLVPRGDGKVLVGATSEDAGFDERVTDEALDLLLEKAARLYPASADFEFVDTWASVRPGTSDDLPILGRILENAYIATGHYRNGILQTPITARLMGELIIGEHENPMLAPFSPNRFTAPPLSEGREE